jgi:hypothetical protein
MTKQQLIEAIFQNEEKINQAKKELLTLCEKGREMQKDLIKIIMENHDSKPASLPIKGN